jgi:FixJ family two-component response regulator
MVAMIDPMHGRSARTLVSPAPNVAGCRIGAAQRLMDSHPDPDRAAVVYLIATDWQVRERLLGELALRGLDVQCFASADEFLQHPRNKSVACIIAQVQRGDATDYELQRQLREDGGPPIIFIGTHLDMPSGIRAIKAGAFDFLIHPVGPEELYSAVEEAFRRHRVLRQRQGEMAALKACYLNLTRREREVFALVVQGFLNKQVAGMLAISLVTVQIHRSNTMRKMGARSFADLVCKALKLQFFYGDLTAGDSSRCPTPSSPRLTDSNFAPCFSTDSY